jgi:hypothetical protein
LGFLVKNQQPLFSLRIDLHHVKRLAYHVDLGDAGSKGIGVGIEDI